MTSRKRCVRQERSLLREAVESGVQSEVVPASHATRAFSISLTSAVKEGGHLISKPARCRSPIASKTQFWQFQLSLAFSALGQGTARMTFSMASISSALAKPICSLPL